MTNPQYGPVAHEPSAQINVLAIIALVASCLGLTVPGVIMGHIALHQIKHNHESGHALAVAALIVGYVLFVLTLVITVGLVVYSVIVIGQIASSPDWENFG